MQLRAQWAESEAELAKRSGCAFGSSPARWGPGSPFRQARRRATMPTVSMPFALTFWWRAVPAGAETGNVVGTYRVLTPDAARRAGGFTARPNST